MTYTPPLNWDLCDGNLTIDGIAMRTPGYGVVDLTDLWLLATFRGASRLVPGAVGVIANPKRRTIVRVDLPFVVNASWDHTGAFQSNPAAGLLANLDYLNTNVISPPALPAHTRAAVLTMPAGAARTAAVQVGDFQPREKSGANRLYTLTLEIPGGTFV